MRAELLMVKYYLKLGHDLTMKSYSKDGYKESREALKKEAHDIQNVLKICTQKNDPTNTKMSDCLADRKVYTTSARHFSLLVRTIIPGTIIDKFLQRCAEIAQERKQHAIKINFDLLLAEQERKESIGKSDVGDYDTMMENIQDEFKMHEEHVQKRESFCANYYYEKGKYLKQKSLVQGGENLIILQNQARVDLKLSLGLRQKRMQMKTENIEHSMDIADTVYSLLELGNAYKIFAVKNEREAKSKFKEAIKLSEQKIGEHELTAHCHKHLGDLFLTTKESKEAEKEYNAAKEMRENLGLETTVKHVFLLRNIGRCFMMNEKTNEAIKILENARDRVEILADSNKANRCKTQIYASLATAYDFAAKALEFEECIHKKDAETMKEIFVTF